MCFELHENQIFNPLVTRVDRNENRIRIKFMTPALIAVSLITNRARFYISRWLIGSDEI